MPEIVEHHPFGLVCVGGAHDGAVIADPGKYSPRIVMPIIPRYSEADLDQAITLEHYIRHPYEARAYHESLPQASTAIVAYPGPLQDGHKIDY